MGSAPPESLIRETLPFAAQWGLLGVLLLVAVVAIILLVNKVFTMSDAHRGELSALHLAHAVAMSSIQDKRLREAADAAHVIAELGEVLAGNTEDQQAIVKVLQTIMKTLDDRVADLPPDTRSPRQRAGAPRV